MGVLNVKVDDKLEREFRKKVIDVYGSKKGALGMAIEEAIRLWLEKHKQSTSL